MSDLSPQRVPKRPTADHPELRREGQARAGNGTNERVICPTGCLCDFVSSPVSKNILFLALVETAIQLAHPVPIRGAFRDRHGRWVRDVVDVMRRSAIVARTNGVLRTVKSCGPDAPTLAFKFAKVIRKRR